MFVPLDHCIYATILHVVIITLIYSTGILLVNCMYHRAGSLVEVKVQKVTYDFSETFLLYLLPYNGWSHQFSPPNNCELSFQTLLQANTIL